MTNKFNHLSSWGMLLIVLLASGCGKSQSGQGHSHASPAARSAPSLLSPQALAALDLKIQPIAKTKFTRYETVQAVVELPPLNRHPLTAPVSGRIAQVHVEPGMQVAAGHPLVTLIRDPLPRVQLTLTEELLKPASEESHESAVNLRKALAELELVQRELKRLNALQTSGDESLVPRKTMIELQYQETRAIKEVDLLKSRLALHGMSEANIADLAAGKPVSLSNERWQASLEANGLWSQQARTLHEALAPEVRNLPWNVAAIGELGALGLLTPALQSWVAETPAVGPRFMFVAGMLQGGHSLADVKVQQQLGALEDEVVLRAPSSAASWDVQALHALPSERVESGTKLLSLIDPSKLLLKIKPAGRELALLQGVIRSDGKVAARPLVKNTGLIFQGLSISHLQSEGTHQEPVAYLPITNEVLMNSGARRSWAVQPGTRYVVELPIEEWPGVWVLPAEAIAEDGADSVVFVENGDSFTATKVTPLFRDDQVVVISPKSSLFPGDPVVTRNAFGLSLALNAGGSSEVDPHAGHNH